MVEPTETMKAVLFLERRRGSSFQEAFDHALAEALLDVPEERREQWGKVMLDLRDVWANAYIDRGATLLGPLAAF
jgi:hypothetical protein